MCCGQVIDDQVDALAANAVKALGSFWGGLNNVAKTSWGLTTDITRKVRFFFYIDTLAVGALVTSGAVGRAVRRNCKPACGCCWAIGLVKRAEGNTYLLAHAGWLAGSTGGPTGSWTYVAADVAADSLTAPWQHVPARCTHCGAAASSHPHRLRLLPRRWPRRWLWVWRRGPHWWHAQKRVSR